MVSISLSQFIILFVIHDSNINWIGISVRLTNVKLSGEHCRNFQIDCIFTQLGLLDIETIFPGQFLPDCQIWKIVAINRFYISQYGKLCHLDTTA